MPPSPYTSLPPHLPSLTLPLILIAFTLRILIIFITSSYDTNALVKYTDVDYFVFDDAARFVYEGESPYMRKTYRYTPLLAYLMLPNHIISSQLFGKIVFCCIDVMIAWLVLRIGTMRESEIVDTHRAGEASHTTATPTTRRIPQSWWLTIVSLTVLFNPIVLNISTRGNADQLVLALVLGALYMFYRRRYLSCALLYGLSVHFKIYPIIYAPVFYLAIADREFNVAARVYPVRSLKDKCVRTLKLLGRGLCSVKLWSFTLLSAGVVLVLGALFYALYGYECIYETYLYHLIRSDNRHNFSVYFYHIYLSVMAPKSLTALLMFVPQMMVLLLMAFLMYREILECILVQTMAFVAFNKVCTVQYFVWYIPLFSFLLLRHVRAGAVEESVETNEGVSSAETSEGGSSAGITNATKSSGTEATNAHDSIDAATTPSTQQATTNDTNQQSSPPESTQKRLIFNVATCIVIWFIAQALWLQSAYELEFLGRNTFMRVWLSGLIFFASNIGIIVYVLLSRQRELPRVEAKVKQE